jgi:cation transport ATPase
MDCSSCAAKIEGATRRIEGVGEIRVSIVSQIMTLRVENPKAVLPKVEETVIGLGYRLDWIGTRQENASSDKDDNESVPDLTHATRAYRWALWIVVLLNVGYGVIEMVGGFLAGFQALKADALDFMGDGLISFLGLVAIGWPIV